METSTGEYWNHNVHYQRVILNAVPDGCGAAVDIGCGDGMLARKLAVRCAAVTGIDQDERMAKVAAERGRAVPGLGFVHGDFLAYPFDEGSFDFACANTSLHQMDFGAALAKMARILRPGGRLAVIGIGNNGSPVDWVIDAAGIPVNLYYKFARDEGYPGAPITEPDMTWGQIHQTAARVLPGARYRRLLMWRYCLVWTKPA